MNKKKIILALAVPVLGLAIYTMFHDDEHQGANRCFICRNSRKIMFGCGGVTAGLVGLFYWSSKE